MNSVNDVNGLNTMSDEERRRALRHAVIRAARRPDGTEGGARCPWCYYRQYRIPDYPMREASHDYTCEHCGKPITVTVHLHTGWALTLRKPDEAPTEPEASE